MTTDPKHVRRGGGGLILVVLIGLAVVLALYFAQGGGNKSYMQNVVDAKKSGEDMASRLQVKSVMDSLAAFKISEGRLPASMEELADSMGGGRAAFTDRWGTFMKLEVDASQRPEMVIVTTAGPDAQWGTEDDERFEQAAPL